MEKKKESLRGVGGNVVSEPNLKSNSPKIPKNFPEKSMGWREIEYTLEIEFGIEYEPMI